MGMMRGTFLFAAVAAFLCEFAVYGQASVFID